MSEHISSLPPGWTTEVRTRKTGHKDRYFTDPVTGYVFRSFKDVERYLKTGEVGKLAFKPKDKARVNTDLGDDKSTPNVVAEEKLADTGTDGKLDGSQTSELVEGVKNEQQITESNSTGDCTSLSEQAIDQSKGGPAISGVNQPEAVGVEQTEGNSKRPTDTVLSAPLISALPENQHRGNGSKRRGTKRSNGKGEPEFPRRASKRLAGIKLDPVLEMKSSSQTRRAARQSAEPETGPDENSGENANQLVTSEKLTSGENLGEPVTPEKLTSIDNSGELITSEKLTFSDDSGEIITSEKLPSNAETKNTPDEKKIVPKPEEHAVLVETDNKDAAKPESPLNLSLTDLWTDPCIEFAVKTLTGAIPIGDGNGDTVPVSNPIGDGNRDTVPVSNPIVDGNGAMVPVSNENVDVNKTNENLGSPLDLSFGDLWTDPCIEFAVKTLTGTFPSDGEGELSVQDYFQQNIGFSQTGVDNFCQTELLSKHFEDPEKPLAAPELPCTQNVTLQNAGDGGGLHQRVEGRSGPGPSVV